VHYIVNPNIELKGQPNGALLEYKPFGLSIQISEKLSAFIQKFQHSDAIVPSEAIDADVFSFFLQNFIFIQSDEKEIFKYGLLERSACSLKNAVDIRSLDSELSCKYALLGVPYDSTTYGSITSRNAPDKLRKCIKRKPTVEDQFMDIGDVVFHPRLENYRQLGCRISKCIALTREKNKIPVMLGGDHSFSYYGIEGLADKYRQLNIVQLDAHTDCCAATDEKNDFLNHANFIRKLVASPKIKTVFQIGCRDSVTYEHEKLRQIKELREINHQLFQDKITPTYLTIDIDVLDPIDAPSVNAPISNGLRVQETVDIIRAISRQLNIVGIDLMEVGTTETKTAANAIELLSSILNN